MKPTQIPSVDNLLAGTGPAIGPGSDEAGIGAVQDLLRGHGFGRMPGVRDAGRGQFGPRTRAAVAAFRANHGLPHGDTVDRQTLQALLAVRAVAPIASQAYVTLVLDIEFTRFAKLVSLVAAVEGAGKFAALNPNTDRAGLSVGIIQWAQKPGRLHELIDRFNTAKPDTLNALFGGPANVAGVLTHTAKPKGGVNADGTTSDPAFDLIHEPWKSRFRSACLNLELQAVQVAAAVSAFAASFQKIQTDMPKLTSERGVAFALDLANQFGDSGAKKIYDAVEAGVTDPNALLAKMRDRSVERLRALFPKLPQVARAGTDRRNFFLSTGLLADTGFVPDGTSAPPSAGGNLLRYFRPADPSLRLVAPITGTNATPLIGGVDALAAMRHEITTASGNADFIYMLNWHCDIDLQLVPGDATSTLRVLLSAAAATGVQIRAMFWAGVSLPPLPLAAPLLLPSSIIIPYELLRVIVAARAVEHDVNEKAVNFIETGAGGDGAAILDKRHLPAGSHHQKVLVIGAGGKLTAFVGGIEYNTDRLPPPTTKGSPLFDISVRLEDGGAAWPALDTFVGRWNAHPDKHGSPLRGGSLPIPLPVGGNLTVQMTHTSAKGFPYPVAVQSAGRHS